MSAFLGVTESLSGKSWVGPDLETDRLAAQIAQQSGLPHALSIILARLDVTLESLDSFLDPKIKDLMPDPRQLRDMEKASSRINSAIEAKERIAIFGDYDVDGATSAAILSDYLIQLGVNPHIYIPDRITEGYGPNPEAMRKLSQAHDLIICVDCGTVSFEAISAASSDVIVIDHHLGQAKLPEALAVVNPNRADEDGQLDYLCAAGVVFLVLVEVNRQRREAAHNTPELLPLLDLVALGTVADVAPLKALNRAFVVQGLKVMAGRKRIGLAALGDIAGVKSYPTTYHLGYVLGPRINAGGRIGKADIGARLLCSTDPHEATVLAEKLNQLNHERKTIEAEVQLKAFEQIEERGTDRALLWAAGKDWHPGVVGIVAARIKEKTNRPTIILGVDEAEAKGSGRSVAGINLGSAISNLVQSGILQKGGGHKMAAGFSCTPEEIEEAMMALEKLLMQQGAATLGGGAVKVDGAISIKAATLELVEQMEQAGPFGAGARNPVFVMGNLSVEFVKVVGENHLKLNLSDDESNKIDAIFFNAAETPSGLALSDHKGQKFHFAGRLDINEWQGKRSVQLIVQDVAFAA